MIALYHFAGDLADFVLLRGQKNVTLLLGIAEGGGGIGWVSSFPERYQIY